MLFSGSKKGKIEPRIVVIGKPVKAAGYSVRTSVKTVFKDIPSVLKKYLDYKNKNGVPNQLEPWVYLSLSENYDPKTMSWDYRTGYAVSNLDKIPEGMTAFEMPAGEYAVFEVRSKIPLFLGFKIPAIKEYAMNKWFPGSGYEAAGIDLEYNDANLPGNQGVDIYFLIRKKGK